MLQYITNIYQIFCKLLCEDFQMLVENENQSGMTPFLISVETMNHEVMEYLISECLCSVFAVNSNLENALHIGAKNSCIKTLCLLL
jgi:hypothetical protein